MSAGDREDRLGVIRAELIRLGGGYLRNVRTPHPLICTYCSGIPGVGFTTCFNCSSWQYRAELADRLGFVTYATDQTQSAHVMYGYKARPPAPTNAWVVRLLHHYGISAHWRCINEGRLGPVTHWCTVPSLGGRPGTHPLRAMGAELLQETHPLADLVAAPGAVATRDLRPENFILSPETRDLAGAHVLLIEDTWVGGGRVQSAAAALKLAGARAVTAFVLARWLDPRRGNTRELLATLTDDFEPNLCPFGGHDCGAPLQ